MLIKIILIYLLIGAVLDLVGRLISLRDKDELSEIKSFGDLCDYIIAYLLVIITWPLPFIKGIIIGIKCHK